MPHNFVIHPLRRFQTVRPEGRFEAPRAGYLHRGTDWPAPEGTPVRAIFNCRVIDTGYDNVYGYFVKVRSFRGHEALIGHLRHPSTLRVGQLRLRGIHAVGEVGHTGMATGPHCHLSIWEKRNGALTLVDPERFIDTH